MLTRKRTTKKPEKTPHPRNPEVGSGWVPGSDPSGKYMSPTPPRTCHPSAEVRDRHRWSNPTGTGLRVSARCPQVSAILGDLALPHAVNRPVCPKREKPRSS